MLTFLSAHCLRQCRAFGRGRAVAYSAQEIRHAGQFPEVLRIDWGPETRLAG